METVDGDGDSSNSIVEADSTCTTFDAAMFEKVIVGCINTKWTPSSHKHHYSITTMLKAEHMIQINTVLNKLVSELIPNTLVSMEHINTIVHTRRRTDHPLSLLVDLSYLCCCSNLHAVCKFLSLGIPDSTHILMNRISIMEHLLSLMCDEESTDACLKFIAETYHTEELNRAIIKCDACSHLTKLGPVIANTVRKMKDCDTVCASDSEREDVLGDVAKLAVIHGCATVLDFTIEQSETGHPSRSTYLLALSIGYKDPPLPLIAPRVVLTQKEIQYLIMFSKPTCLWKAIYNPNLKAIISRQNIQHAFRECLESQTLGLHMAGMLLQAGVQVAERDLSLCAKMLDLELFKVLHRVCKRWRPHRVSNAVADKSLRSDCTEKRLEMQRFILSVGSRREIVYPQFSIAGYPTVWCEGSGSD